MTKQPPITKRVEAALCQKYRDAIKAGTMRESEAAMSCGSALSLARSLVRLGRKISMSDEQILESARRPVNPDRNTGLSNL